MDEKSIIYSLDNKITISQLKKTKKIELKNTEKEKFLEYCKKNNIKSLIWEKKLFKKTKQIPYITYYIWNLDILKTKKIIAIVWPRQMNTTTSRLVKDFFKKIKYNNRIAIISGLADGVDSLAHNLAIENNIPTISVLWFGLAKAISWNTKHLIKKIVDNNWLVISEFKLKQPGTNWTFPQRNRIIAWLSDVLFVPQARENSWTLITIDDAIKIKIPIFSCFSSIYNEIWTGTNKLIAQNHIKWIYDLDIWIQEILDTLKINNLEQNDKAIDTTCMSDKEKLIFEAIKTWSNTIDLICNNINLDSWEILNLLSMMEISWYINENNWEYYI